MSVDLMTKEELTKIENGLTASLTALIVLCGDDPKLALSIGQTVVDELLRQFAQDNAKTLGFLFLVAELRWGGLKTAATDRRAPNRRCDA